MFNIMACLEQFPKQITLRHAKSKTCVLQTKLVELTQ